MFTHITVLWQIDFRDDDILVSDDVGCKFDRFVARSLRKIVSFNVWVLLNFTPVVDPPPAGEHPARPDDLGPRHMFLVSCFLL